MEEITSRTQAATTERHRRNTPTRNRSTPEPRAPQHRHQGLARGGWGSLQNTRRAAGGGPGSVSTHSLTLRAARWQLFLRRRLDLLEPRSTEDTGRYWDKKRFWRWTVRISDSLLHPAPKTQAQLHQFFIGETEEPHPAQSHIRLQQNFFSSFS